MATSSTIGKSLLEKMAEGICALVPSKGKWRQPQRNFQVGDLVIVANDNVARYKWLLARVVEVYSGADGLVRSVYLRCKGSSLKRPVTKICLLEAEQVAEF